MRTRDLAIDDHFLDRLTRAKGRAIVTASRPSELEAHVTRKSRAVGGNQHPVMKGELEGPLPLVFTGR